MYRMNVQWAAAWLSWDYFHPRPSQTDIPLKAVEQTFTGPKVHFFKVRDNFSPSPKSGRRPRCLPGLSSESCLFLVAASCLPPLCIGRLIRARKETTTERREKGKALGVREDTEATDLPEPLTPTQAICPSPSSHQLARI